MKSNDQIKTAFQSLATAPNTTIESLKALLKDKVEKATLAKKNWDECKDTAQLAALSADADDASDEVMIVEFAIEHFNLLKAKETAAKEKLDTMVDAGRDRLKAAGFKVHQTAVKSVPYYEAALNRKPSLLNRIAAVF